MGQYWLIFDIDDEMTIPIGAWKLGEWLFDSNLGSKSVKQFVIPLEPPAPDPLFLTADVRNSLGALGLPAELLHAIVTEVADDDILSFARTNTHILSMSRRRIYDVYAKSAAGCAGHRLICVGDYAENNDLPPGMLTEQEEEEFGLAKLGRDADEDGGDDNTLYSYAGRQDAIDPCWYDHSVSEYVGKFPVSSKERAMLLDILTPRYIDVGRPDAVWALCNLSKHMYVRADATAALTHSKAEGPFIDGEVNLMHVLVSRICWSSDPSTSACYTGDLHRGVWAGNRFEITTLDRLKPGKWTDVSEEVLDEVAMIWDSEYGNSKWREG